MNLTYELIKGTLFYTFQVHISEFPSRLSKLVHEEGIHVWLFIFCKNSKINCSKKMVNIHITSFQNMNL